MSGFLDVRRRALKRQVETVRRALQSPTGLFETVDNLLRNFRLANKEIIANLKTSGTRGMKLPGLLERLRQRW